MKTLGGDVAAVTFEALVLVGGGVMEGVVVAEEEEAGAVGTDRVTP